MNNESASDNWMHSGLTPEQVFILLSEYVYDNFYWYCMAGGSYPKGP